VSNGGTEPLKRESEKKRGSRSGRRNEPVKSRGSPTPKLTDMVGRWTVLSLAPKRGRHRYWLCRCACGTEREVLGASLSSGQSHSCGCLRTERPRKHGLSSSREYKSWTQMKQRCLNPGCERFKNYGGRGIRVCERWLRDFQRFLKDMGPRPPDHSLHRIENDGDYTPENCKWATRKEQDRHRRSNRYVEFRGERLVMADWANRLGMSRGGLHSLLKNGHTLDSLFASREFPRAA
jgi:hypothetical protein